MSFHKLITKQIFLTSMIGQQNIERVSDIPIMIKYLGTYLVIIHHNVCMSTDK